MPDEPLFPPSADSLSGASVDALIAELAKRAQCNKREDTSDAGRDVLAGFGENGKQPAQHVGRRPMTDEERDETGCLVVLMLSPKTKGATEDDRQFVAAMIGEGRLIMGALESAAERYMMSIANRYGSEGDNQ